MQAREALGMFGLPDHGHEIKIKMLSGANCPIPVLGGVRRMGAGGQKARVLFAQIALASPDIILLDGVQAII